MPSRQVPTLIVLGSGVAHSIHTELPLCALLFGILRSACNRLHADGLPEHSLCRPCETGGHTAEMLTLTAHLDMQRYTPRCYVVAASDRMGEAKANAVEACGREVLVMPGCCCCSNTETSARASSLPRRHLVSRQLCTKYHAAVRLASPTSPRSGQRWLLCVQLSP